MKQFVPLFLLLVAIFGSIFYTKPLYTEIQKLLSDKEQYEESLAKARELDNKVTELNNIRNSFSGENLDRLNKMIPEKVDTVRLVIEINEIAKKYSTGIKSINITNTADLQASQKKSSAKATEDAFALGFTVTTTYDKFQDFLQDIESNLRLADVTGVSFSPLETGQYDFSVTIKTYWSK